jgi:ATP-dependent Clp protease ATP-binding subunit ClpC
MSVVSKWTGVPLQRMETAEAEKLLKMESELKGKVIGQDEAVIAISKALRRSRADLKDPRRPIGSFLFLGPTGVGKTFLAKNLAEFMFGTAEALIQIDMSEYMEKHTASRLIGAPPGYVGYEEGGQLSEAVRRRPYSVILFDEVEKAHPDVMHLLLQILEEGQVTDNFGRKIDFRNTIVILTSNVGAEQIKRQTSLGFMAMQQDAADNAGIKGKITEAAKKFFKPEFLNRLDDIVIFQMLEKSSSTSSSISRSQGRRPPQEEEHPHHARRHRPRVPHERGLRSAVWRPSDAPCRGKEHRRSAGRASPAW